MAVVTERVADQRDTAPEFALIAKDVLKAFLSREKAVRAVDGISLAVRRGEIYGLLGANGSGKSTLLRLLAALLAADSGEISVFGRDLKAEEMAVKRLVNRVAVDASFFKKLSALENLVYAGRMYGVPPTLCRGRAKKVLERLGIGEKRHDEALEKLSRGMQQKVAIARSLLTSPALVLLDEPTAGLDIRSKREVQAFIRELRAEHDATIVLATHDLEEAERLSDRIGIVERGRLVGEGTVVELLAEASASTLEEAFMSLTAVGLDDGDESDEETKARAS